MVIFPNNFCMRIKILIEVFEICSDCLKLNGRMSTIVPGAYCTRKVRENEMYLSKMSPKDNNQKYEYPDSRLTELSPLKYNSKLMNSIWGLYNRYSVHNFKQNTDANQHILNGEQQKKEIVVTPTNGGGDSTNGNCFTNAFNDILPAMFNTHY
ncbi:uncharacterized protein LOC123301781 [Chrysoperla carnea]|uniref:uncharacterized protein LOC123301781 n=1 Tax=Chrysoperla carnea TaxID=189513 RepID=UPI001D080A5E|nr:uncharacterized protein LOC123301781 [Chrysoperla carnea]